MSHIPLSTPDLQESLQTLKARSHVGAFYETSEERLRLAVPAIRIALERGETCVYASDDRAAQELVEALRPARKGVDADLLTGALVIEQWPAANGAKRAVQPDGLARTLERLVVEGAARGAPGLRLIVDLTRVFAAESPRDVVELEQALTWLTERHEVLVLCLHDRRACLPELCIPALRSHPVVISGNLACANPYYLPEAPFRSSSVAADVLEPLLADLRVRQSADDDLRRTQSLFAAFMEHLPGFAWMKRVDGTYEFVNKEVTLIPGYGKTMRGQTDYDILPKEIADVYRVNDTRVAETGKALQVVEPFYVPGDERFILASKFPITNDAGAVVMVGGAGFDITEHMRAEHALREALRESSMRQQEVSRSVIEAQESERRRLSRELHDHVGQALTGLKLNLQTLGQSSPSDKTAECIAIVDQLLQQTRQLSLDLRPPLLDDLGLAPALRWYLDEQAQRAGLRTSFSADPPGDDLSPEVAIACFRVAQEAITNIVRHAKAKEVGVNLRRRGGYLHLIVCDDGIGFDPARTGPAATPGLTLGLVGMRERAALLGGRLSIKSQKGSGTDIHAVFPTDTAT